MPKTVRRIDVDVAHITPRVLTWAIDRSKYSREQLAERLRVSLEELRSWEKGVYPPTRTAEKISLLLNVPYGAFYLNEPPSDDLPVPDMRRRVVGYKPTANFQDVLRDVLVRRDWYKGYALDRDGNERPFVGRYGTSSDVKEVAADMRRVLGLGHRARSSVSTFRDYAALLASKAEAVGILVMRSKMVGNNSRRRIDPNEVQGFAIADRVAPVVFVNTADFQAAQIFTTAHELAHIWIGKSAISNPNQGEVRNSNDIENFCNSVATEALVPEAQFAPVWRVHRQDALRVIPRMFWVSALVVVRRARELGYITHEEAGRLREQAIGMQRERDGEASGRTKFLQNVSVRAGKRFTEAVISEVTAGNVSFKHGARLLGMRTATLAGYTSLSNAP